MNNKRLDLDYLINLEKFQTIQDDIARATDMAVIAIDYKGHPITEHSQCSPFCANVRKDPQLRKQCEKCDSRGGLEAVRSQDEYIYLCHLGIVDIALPLIVDGQYLGALMAGQIRLENQDNQQVLERIVSKKYQTNIENHPTLQKLYKDLPVMKLEKIQAVAHMIHHLMNYIVGEAILKVSLYDINQRLIAYSKEHPEFDQEVTDIQLYYPLDKQPVHTEQLAGTLSELLTAGLIDGDPVAAHKSILLKPALDYIDKHSDQKIYIDKMAYLCNISTSYFSKIFKKETGYNFSTYVNNVKTHKAKEMLESSATKIVNISLELGFDDCGYFIKVFKKNFGVTPATYRKNYRAGLITDTPSPRRN